MHYDIIPLNSLHTSISWAPASAVQAEEKLEMWKHQPGTEVPLLQGEGLCYNTAYVGT